MADQRCPSCNTPVQPGTVFCDTCGYDLRNIGLGSPPEGIKIGITCPRCGHQNLDMAVFCENCGIKFGAAELNGAILPNPGESLPLLNEVPGWLELRQTGEKIAVPSGKPAIIMGREDPISGIFPDIDLEPHGGLEAGVGRQHVRIFILDGRLFLEDMNSVNGTILNRQSLHPYRPVLLMDGDEIHLGKLGLVYHR